MAKWVTLKKVVTHLKKGSHSKNRSKLAKWITLKKMGHTCSQVVKYPTLGEKRLWKIGSPLEKWVILQKFGHTLKKTGSPWKNGSLKANGQNLRKSSTWKNI